MFQQSVFRSEAGKSEILNFYTKLLDKWLKPNRQQHVSTRYGETFVISCGIESKPPLVLLHGSSSNSAIWMADVAEYSKYYHVHAIDIIGECGLSAENRHEWKNNHYANWLSEIFEKLNVNNAVLVAYSMGGWIAIDFCLIYQKKVSNLVLIATAGVSQVRVKTIFTIILVSMFGKAGLRRLYKMIYSNLEINKSVLEFTSLVKLHFKPRTDLLPLFSDNQLRQIKIPVLFIGGDKDCFYDSFKTTYRLSNNIVDVKNVVLKNTGHVLKETNSIVIDFLKNSR